MVKDRNGYPYDGSPKLLAMPELLFTHVKSPLSYLEDLEQQPCF